MTVGNSGYSSAKPGQYDPSWGVPCPQRIWGTSGNTDTVYDASVHPSSCVIITPVTGTYTLQGPLTVAVSQGSFVVTSGNSETAGAAYNYFICGN